MSLARVTRFHPTKDGGFAASLADAQYFCGLVKCLQAYSLVVRIPRFRVYYELEGIYVS